MASNYCTHRGCRNIIRSGQTLCYVHGGASAAELDAGAPRKPGTHTMAEWWENRKQRALAKLEPFWRIVSNPPLPSLGLTRRDREAEAVTFHLPIDIDTSEAIQRAQQNVLGKHVISNPIEAAQNLGRIADVARALSAEVGHDRVAVERMQGLVVKTATRPRRYNKSTVHDVIVLNPGAEDELIVDPFVAALAPVKRDRAHLPIEESEMPGWSTSPYVDGTYIATRDEYMENGYFEWKGSTRIG